MGSRSYDIVFQEFKPYIQGSLNVCDQLPEIQKKTLEKLLEESINILKLSSNVIKVSAPCIVIGDLHGNISDLINILKKFNDYTSYHFLFLGDYVDRGINSIEVITLLLALMCKFPFNFHLIRGNHEFANINRQYGFQEEIQIVYRSKELWEDFQKVFNWLPLAAIVNNQIFCVHGGLSPSLKKVSSIDEIPRPIRNYDNPLISDLVWADPHDQIQGFSQSHRGSGVFYGESAVRTFLNENNLKLLIRAHQCMADGFCTFAANSGITVFSSSEYCKLIHNKCGIIKVSSKGKIDLYNFSHDDFRTYEPKYTMIINRNGIGMKRMFKQIQNSNPNVSNDQKRHSPKIPSFNNNSIKTKIRNVPYRSTNPKKPCLLSSNRT